MTADVAGPRAAFKAAALLPSSLRVALYLTAILSGFVVFFSMHDALGLLAQGTETPTFEGYEASTRTLLLEIYKAERAATGPMRGVRTFTLLVLVWSGISALTSAVAALRVRPFAPGPRLEYLRRLLVANTLVCALARATEGAALAVINKRVGVAFHGWMTETLRENAGRPGFPQPGFEAPAQDAVVLLWQSASLFHTALLAGTFAMLFVYFSSPRLKARFAS